MPEANTPILVHIGSIRDELTLCKQPRCQRLSQRLKMQLAR